MWQRSNHLLTHVGLGTPDPLADTQTNPSMPQHLNIFMFNEYVCSGLNGCVCVSVGGLCVSSLLFVSLESYETCAKSHWIYILWREWFWLCVVGGLCMPSLLCELLESFEMCMLWREWFWNDMRHVCCGMHSFCVRIYMGWL